MLVKSEEYDRVIDELEKRLGIRSGGSTGDRDKDKDKGQGKDKAPSQEDLEKQAIEWCYEHYEAHLKKAFANARVVWGLMAKLKQVKNIASDARSLKSDVEKVLKSTPGKTASSIGTLAPSTSSAASTASKAASATSSGASKLAGMKDLAKPLGELTGLAGTELMGVFNELGGGVVTDLGTSMVPLISEVKSGAQAASKWYDAARALHRDRAARRNVEQVRSVADAKAAAKAVNQLIQRERNQFTTEASIRTTQFATTVGGDFMVFDGGQTVRSVAAAVATGAKLAHKIYLFGRDYSEMLEANRLINDGRIDRELLIACPLLGAYLVANCDTSYLCGLLAGPDGRSRMSVDAMEEIIKKHIWPLQKEARHFIKASQFTIEGMEGSTKGTVVWESDLGFIGRIRHRIKKKASQKVLDPIRKRLAGAKKAFATKFK